MVVSFCYRPASALQRRQARIAISLAALEAAHNLRILYARKSGNWAWGLLSPDSDYAMRFSYARALDWYLALNEGLDTLNFPVDDELDLAGWGCVGTA